MEWRGSSEFNDPVVRRHRYRAAQRTDRDPVALDVLLEEVAAELGKPEDPRISILKSKWEEMVGPQNAQYSTPGFIRDFGLHIFVSHPGWLLEMKNKARFILMKIQRSYPELKLRKVFFILEK